jgi:hypothetical protein
MVLRRSAWSILFAYGHLETDPTEAERPRELAGEMSYAHPGNTLHAQCGATSCIRAE